MVSIVSLPRFQLLQLRTNTGWCQNCVYVQLSVSDVDYFLKVDTSHRGLLLPEMRTNSMAGSTWYFVNSSTFERWIVYLQINLIVEPFVNFWFRQNCWNIFTSNSIHILSSEMSKIVIFTGPNHFSLFWILVYHCNSSTKCNIFITFQKESSSPQLF